MRFAMHKKINKKNQNILAFLKVKLNISIICYLFHENGLWVANND